MIRVIKILLVIVFIPVFVYGLYIFSPYNQDIDWEKLESIVSEIEEASPQSERVISMYNKIYEGALERSSTEKLINGFFNVSKDCPCYDVAAQSYICKRHGPTVNEYVIAHQIEARESQKQCLYYLLATFDYMYQTTGIENAANLYFDKPLADLTDDELIGLLVMQENVSLYNPKRFKKRYEERVSMVKEEIHIVDFRDCGIKDTLIKFGHLEYQIQKIDGENYEISWGDKEVKRKYPEKFQCWKTEEGDVCDFTPKIDLITEKEIVLRVTTSTPSTGNCSPIEYKMIYLPRSIDEDAFEIEYYLKTENNYTVYSNGLDTISVMNLETKENQSFALAPAPYFEFKTIDSSIDSINISNKELQFRYLIGTHEDYKYTSRKVRLEI